MVIALGVTLGGEKVVLGFVQTGTENATTCMTFLRSLVERGLRVEEGLLVVVDGSEGLRQAVREVFGAQAQVQRCTWHKRENVVSYLPKTQQDVRWSVAWGGCAGGPAAIRNVGGWLVALLDIEPRLRRLRGYRALRQLRTALRRAVMQESDRRTA